MTESRPSGPPRHAEARSADASGANPLDRPLPPGMGRRSATPAHDAGRASAPAAPTAAPDRDVYRQPSRSAGPAHDPFRPSTPQPASESRAAHAFSEPATVAAHGGVVAAATAAPATSRRSRSANGKANAKAANIPLMAPPAWQVAEMQADEREQAVEQAVVSQRGLRGWAALLVLLVITGIGGVIDAVAGAGIKGTFAIGLIVGSLVAIILVRRSGMFPIVIAPPLVYFIASAVLLYVRSGGLSSKTAIIDAATSWLVYGFPAIAGATAVVLIGAGVRMILRR